MKRFEVLVILLLCAVSVFSSCYKDDVDAVIIGEGERLEFDVARSNDFTTRSGGDEASAKSVPASPLRIIFAADEASASHLPARIWSRALAADEASISQEVAIIEPLMLAAEATSISQLPTSAFEMLMSAADEATMLSFALWMLLVQSRLF